MKRQIKKLITSALLICCVFLLFSCSDDETLRDGISVSDEKTAFSEETANKSKDTFFSLLEGAYTAEGLATVPPAKAKEFRSIAERIWEITTDYPISEGEYLSIILEIEKNRESFISLISGKDRGMTVLKSTYEALTAGAGAEYAGYALYHLVSFGMDYKYNQKMERYEKHGYSYLYDEACEIKEELTVLQNEIGEKNFSLAVRVGIMASELFFGGAFEGGKIDSFSDREIIVMLRRVDIASLDISEKGYEFLLGLAVPDSADESGNAYDRIFYTAGKNGDIQKISAAADKLKSFLASVQGNLTDADALLMREGKFGQLLTNVFSRLTDSEWDVFSQISSIELNYAEYEDILSEIYAEDFDVYSSNFSEGVTLDELRNSVNSDSFIEKLEGYLAGISPALTYRIFK